MVELDKLVERVKEECADAYFEAFDDHKNYGVKASIMPPYDSNLLHYATTPYGKFPRWNLLLPKALRHISYDTQDFYRKSPKNGLFFFHYKVDVLEVCKQAQRAEEDNRKWQPDIEFNATRFMVDFLNRFDDEPTCIFPRFTGTGRNQDYVPIPTLVGKRELIQEVMDFLKQGENIVDFLISIRPEQHDFEREFLEREVNYVAIHDLLKRPKKVHLEL